MKKILVLLSSLCCLLFFGCSSRESSDILKVGMELAYPPFEMTDTEGNPTGISVDLARALGESLGKEVKIVNIAWDGLIPSLKTGKIDLIISSMTITEERERTIAFSDPYAKTYLAMLINKDSPVSEFRDLDREGRAVAVKKGSTGHLYAEENLKNASVLVLDKESYCVLEVSQGKADVFLYDQMTIYRNWKNHPDTTRANLRPFQENLEYWGIAMRQDDEELKLKVNVFLGEFKKTGGFDSLAMKYLEDQKKTFDEMGIPFFF